MTPTQPAAAFDVDALRTAEFPLVGEAVYLNAASLGPLPERARRALAEHSEKRARIHTFSDSDVLEPLQRSRAAAARLVGASADEIALGGNTSFGINLAALSLPVERGSRVITSDREFPANVYPWTGRERFGFELVPTTDAGWPDEEAILARLDRGDVSVLALSAVQFASGYRADLVRLGRACRDRGIHFVVDAIQALGQVPIDVEEMCIDVLASGAHKWLLSPFGTGFAYVRRGLIEHMEPRMIGWSSKTASADLASLLDYGPEFVPEARRFEMGTLPFQDFAAFAASVELILEVGVRTIEAHLASILDPLERWLTEREDVRVLSDVSPEHRSAIFVFRPPDPERVHGALAEAGVVCSLREGGIRLAPHLYNTHSEMDRVMTIIRETGLR